MLVINAILILTAVQFNDYDEKTPSQQQPGRKKKNEYKREGRDDEKKDQGNKRQVVTVTNAPI